MADQGKLIIVSTRLPVSITKVDSKIVVTPSTGGLATGMTAVSHKARDSVWVGWPGIASDELTKEDKNVITKELKKHNCHPVFLTQSEIDSYYSGYCNATLWPIFHYFLNKAVFNDEYWRSYKAVNKLFLEEVTKFVDANSRIWVHDYQLMLLPRLIRQEYKHADIGFFLHTPFPSYELFRLIPERDELLRGLLGADLVGFHTYDYARHFLSSVERSLGYESNLGTITANHRSIQVDAFPIGIDYKKFSVSARKIRVKKILRSFNLIKDKTKVILSVDRSDYSKGIPLRLEAYEKFLKDNPEYLGKVVMILLSVPSRAEVQEYIDLRAEIEQKVSNINGKYSTADWSPIQYRHQSLPFEELVALYSRADVMLVTPLRDGMNLVAKEYVATHHKGDGVLILSEMAGAASELAEAIHINPYNRSMVADSIVQALEMPVSEQKDRMRAMQKRIKEYNISSWANDFMSQLAQINLVQKNTKNMDHKTLKKLKADYKSSEKRLILLDYDGTLRDFVSSPDAELGKPTKRINSVLKKLSKLSANSVVIVSGRPKNMLDYFFNGMGLGLIAEHGAWISVTGKWNKSSLTSKKWKKLVLPLLNEYTARTPGSQVEEKDFSIVWHFRKVSPDLAYVRSQELEKDLRKILIDSEAEVYAGHKVLEIKPSKMHKGAQITEMLAEEHWDFILAIGDDYTDEDMFRVLPERAYTINVGNIRTTDARFQLKTVSDVVELLESLTE